MTKREWQPPDWISPFFKLAPWGFPRLILLILADGDRTFSGILDGFAGFMRHMGHYGREEIVVGYDAEAYLDAVRISLEELERADRIALQDGTYSLTKKGRQIAERDRRQYQKFGAFVEGLLHPQTVSLVGLAVHIVLAIFKLIAGTLSGSIGLISDGMDTALDGLSSILVFIGLRLKKGQYINVILVLLMLGVGAGVGYEAIQRILVPETLGVDLSAAWLVPAVCRRAKQAATPHLPGC
jgi:multisubunit Na+/H+ antiporter MnhF subunit